MAKSSREPGILLGRRRERAALDACINDVARGRSASLVLHGEPGIGKTALLEYAQTRAAGYRVLRVAGVEAEAELAFGGLHQLCAPFGPQLRNLPEPQRTALETAFGLSVGSPPDRFLVGLAVLSLLADVAEDEPLVCLVDDAQWLDQISAQTLAFVARRILAERVALVFAVRDPLHGHPLEDLPRLHIVGLDDHDARSLLASVSPSRFDDRERDRILAEAHGNPLALLELPRELSSARMSAQHGWLDDQPLASQIEKGYLRRLHSLTPETQRLVLLAAADPVGDVELVRRAAKRLGIDLDKAGAEAQAADLVTARTMVRFRHPLVRSAAYRFASPEDRRRVHEALAEATDPELDPDRWAWHRANAADTPDEGVAVGLERASARSRARGGMAAAATFLERAAELTPDPGRRGARSLAAAEAKSQAGEFSDALELLDSVRLQPLDEREHVMADLIRGRILFSARSASAGLMLLLEAAKQLESLDPALAKETYRDAIYAALTAGRMPGDTSVENVAAAILAMPRPRSPTRADLLLEGLSRLVIDGYAAGVPLVQHGLAGYRALEISPDEGLGWLPLACRIAHDAWDFDTWSILSATLVDLARGARALAVLPPALLLRLSNRVFAGDLAAADSLAAQAATLGEVTGSNFFAHYGALVIAPWRGQEVEARQAIDVIANNPLLRGEGKVSTATEWSAAVLYNGLGRFDEAFAAAQRGSSHLPELGLSTWSMVELVEAAARLDRPADATEAAHHIQHITTVAGTEWALGTSAYVSALVSEGAIAEERYREAIERLERTEVGMLTARAHLVYGEWLRRERREADASVSLGLAYDRLTEIGAAGFAERARRELAAMGVARTGPTPALGGELTSQEMQIARLAAEGLTNPEIGAQMFISAHTVEWHLRKVFNKLGIRSRKDIRGSLTRVPPP
jgi:DNA-binding CsgD family transcriptional regulator/tetratricopeptide (TPR) repeat protein